MGVSPRQGQTSSTISSSPVVDHLSSPTSAFQPQLMGTSSRSSLNNSLADSRTTTTTTTTTSSSSSSSTSASTSIATDTTQTSTTTSHSSSYALDFMGFVFKFPTIFLQLTFNFIDQRKSLFYSFSNACFCFIPCFTLLLINHTVLRCPLPRAQVAPPHLWPRRVHK